MYVGMCLCLKSNQQLMLYVDGTTLKFNELEKLMIESTPPVGLQSESTIPGRLEIQAVSVCI